jgi:hypothetical protein
MAPIAPVRSLYGDNGVVVAQRALAPGSPMRSAKYGGAFIERAVWKKKDRNETRTSNEITTSFLPLR